MASPQFIEVLKQLHATGQQKPIRWEPLKRASYSQRCDFCIALGNGVIHLTGKDDNYCTRQAGYTAYLMTRDGLMVDEFEANQHESEFFPLLEELFQQARNAAFNFPRMLEDIQADLAAGKVRELPKQLVKPYDDDEIPF